MCNAVGRLTLDFQTVILERETDRQTHRQTDRERERVREMKGGKEKETGVGRWRRDRVFCLRFAHGFRAVYVSTHRT